MKSPAEESRTEELREALLERKRTRESQFMRANALTLAFSLRSSEGIPSWQLRRGILTRDRLSAVRFEMDPRERLIGRIAAPQEEPDEDSLVPALVYLGQFPPPPGQNGHCELDVGPLLERGIEGVGGLIQEHLEAAKGEQIATYQSFLLGLEGLSNMIDNAAEAAEAALARAPSRCQAHLQETAASCRRISMGRPQSFQDAIQLLWFVLLGVQHGEDVGLVVPGHIDRSLFPFYHRDRERGALTRHEALLLIEDFYLLINDYVTDGLAVSVMVGGKDAQGEDVTNGLSHLCLEALRRTRLLYPTVGICWHEGTPPELVDLAVDLVAEGCPNPAFFGDDTIQRSLKALGVPAEEACHYINATCVEITPATSSNVWVAASNFNTCQLLLEEIAEQVEKESASSFDEFLMHYHDRLVKRVEEAAAAENQSRQERQKHGRKPLQSVLTRDCIERGRDIDDDGARYNWIECSFLGLANLADSLYVLREEVFRQKKLSLAELKAALDADFEGHEALCQRFLHEHPKHGHDNAEVDELFAGLVQSVQDVCAKQRMKPDDSLYVPGALCWDMHKTLGRECGATPDGRKKGMPFADGCGPAQGRETKGPAAAILSTTSWNHSPMIGGLACNTKLDPRLFNEPEGKDALRDFIVAYLRRGGFEIQVRDREKCRVCGAI